MSRLCFILAVALVTATPVGVASAQAQAPRSQDVRVKLSTRGVDFNDRAQVKVFYERIKAAAQAVCVSDNLAPGGVKEEQACRSRFISDAVDRVNAPLLTEMNDPGSREASPVDAPTIDR